MEFHREPADESRAILACAAGEIRLPGRRFTASVILTAGAVVEGWRPPPVERMTIGDFQPALDARPDVLLLGTGASQRLPPPALYAAFAERGIGLEVMDNAAACRTYNVLLSEFREVALALLL